MLSVEQSRVSAESRVEKLDALARKHPLLWRGHQHKSATGAVLPTGFAELDEALPGGGWPGCGIVEVNVVSWGQGELSLFLPLMRRLNAKSQQAAGMLVWVAPPYMPYAPALLQAGISLSHLWVLDAKISAKDQLWAVEKCLRQPGALILFWPSRISHKAVQRLRLAAINAGALGVMFCSRSSGQVSDHLPVDLRLKVQRLDIDSKTELELGQVSGLVSTLAIDVLAARYHFAARQRVLLTLGGDSAW